MDKLKARSPEESKNSPALTVDPVAVVRSAIKEIGGKREHAFWRHGLVNGMMDAFGMQGLLERKDIKSLNTEADEALEKVTHAHLRHQDI